MRALTSLGLKEAKELVEAAPKAVLEKVTKEAAEKAKEQLEAAGASVSRQVTPVREPLRSIRSHGGRPRVGHRCCVPTRVEPGLTPARGGIFRLHVTFYGGGDRPRQLLTRLLLCPSVIRA